MAATYLFAGIGAFIVGRIARSVLFLEIPNYHQQLPLVYVLIALAVSPSMVAYSHFERRLRRDHTNAITLSSPTDPGAVFPNNNYNPFINGVADIATGELSDVDVDAPAYASLDVARLRVVYSEGLIRPVPVSFIGKLAMKRDDVALVGAAMGRLLRRHS